jgi:hypothetical protein
VLLLLHAGSSLASCICERCRLQLLHQVPRQLVYICQASGTSRSNLHHSSHSQNSLSLV